MIICISLVGYWVGSSEGLVLGEEDELGCKLDDGNDDGSLDNDGFILGCIDGFVDGLVDSEGCEVGALLGFILGDVDGI